jgi:hypothetical protein
MGHSLLMTFCPVVVRICPLSVHFLYPMYTRLQQHTQAVEPHYPFWSPKACFLSFFKLWASCFLSLGNDWSGRFDGVHQLHESSSGVFEQASWSPLMLLSPTFICWTRRGYHDMWIVSSPLETQRGHWPRITSASGENSMAGIKIYITFLMSWEFWRFVYS